MNENLNDMAKYIRNKKVLILAGELCNEVDFGEKKLLDYAVEISNKINAPIAAAGNTAIPLRERGAKSVRKMWAMEVMNYIRCPWEQKKEHHPIMDKKPEVLLLIGYTAMTARSIVSTVNEDDCKIVVLGSTYMNNATYSLPNVSSLEEWSQNLQKFVSFLGA